jgi:hypothetical protein
MDLTYVMQDEVLLITTPEEAETQLLTKAYPVADLVLPVGQTGAVNADFDSLIELITSTVQPTAWDEVGGPGSIAAFDTNMSLVLSQTQEVHEEISDLLEQLRRLKAQQGDGAAGVLLRQIEEGADPFGDDEALDADLLKGLQETNRTFQGQQVDKLQKMYGEGMGGGMGGVGAGKAF